MRKCGFMVIFLGIVPGSWAAGTPVPCAAPAYRQLDFWVGDWDSYENGGSGPMDARNRVTSILGGCVIHERYEQADGLVGESFSIYDAGRKTWHQTWVTNRGTLLTLEGRFQGDRLVLQGTNLAADGKPQTIRGLWRAQADGVRETAYISKDDGKSWNPYFDILFKPHH